MIALPQPSDSPMKIGVVSAHGLLGDLLVLALKQRGHRPAPLAHSSFDAMRHEAVSCDAIVVCAWGLARRGRRLVRSICVTHPRLRVVIVDESFEDDDFHDALLAGAVAVIGSRSRLEEALDLIESAARGDSKIPRLRAHPSPSPSIRPALLTRRETEILQLTVDGLRVTEIADRLFISEKTVKHHLSASYAKLGAGNRTAAVINALRNGLVDLGER